MNKADVLSFSICLLLHLYPFLMPLENNLLYEIFQLLFIHLTGKCMEILVGEANEVGVLLPLEVDFGDCKEIDERVDHSVLQNQCSYENILMKGDKRDQQRWLQVSLRTNLSNRVEKSLIVVVVDSFIK